MAEADCAKLARVQELCIEAWAHFKLAPEIHSIALAGRELLLTPGTVELRSVTLIGLK